MNPESGLAEPPAPASTPAPAAPPAASDAFAEDPFDRLTRMASRLIGAPVALIALLEAGHFRLRSQLGLGLGGRDLPAALCAATAEGGDALIISDAKADPRFARDPAVTGPPHLRAFGGVPLRRPFGTGVAGVFCVLDRSPRPFTPEQVKTLKYLAAIAEDEIDKDGARSAVPAAGSSVLAGAPPRSDDAEEVVELRRLFASHDTAVFLHESMAVGMRSPISGVNDAGCDLLGYPRSALLHSSLGTLFHQTQPGWIEEIDRMLGSGCDVVFKVALRSAHGEPLPVELNTRLLPAGSPLAAYSVVTRIAGLPGDGAASNGLPVAEEASGLLCRFRPDGTLTLVNDAYCACFGEERRNLEGFIFRPLTAEEDRHVADKAIASLTASNPTTTCEFRVYGADGLPGWQRWTYTGMFDDNGRALEVQAVGGGFTPPSPEEEEPAEETSPDADELAEAAEPLDAAPTVRIPEPSLDFKPVTPPETMPVLSVEFRPPPPVEDVPFAPVGRVETNRIPPLRVADAPPALVEPPPAPTPAGPFTFKAPATRKVPLPISLPPDELSPASSVEAPPAEKLAEGPSPSEPAIAQELESRESPEAHEQNLPVAPEPSFPEPEPAVTAEVAPSTEITAPVSEPVAEENTTETPAAAEEPTPAPPVPAEEPATPAEDIIPPVVETSSVAPQEAEASAPLAAETSPLPHAEALAPTPSPEPVAEPAIETTHDDSAPESTVPAEPAAEPEAKAAHGESALESAPFTEPVAETPTPAPVEPPAAPAPAAPEVWAAPDFSVATAEVISPKAPSTPPPDVIDHLDEVVFAASVPEARVLFLSRPAERLTGRPNSDFEFQPGLWRELFHADDHPALRRALASLLEEGRAEFSARLLRPAGEPAWVQGRAWVAHRAGEGGTPERIEGVLRDVSERRRAEEALRASEAKFRDMALNTPGVVFQWNEREDGNSGFVYASPRLYEVFGIPTEDARTLVDKLHEADRERWRESLAAARINPGPWTFEGRLHCPDGQVRWLSCAAKPVRYSPGDLLFNGVMLDITERKRAEEQFRASEERFRLVLQASNDGIWDWDLARREIYLSSRWAEMLGYSREEIGSSPRALLRLLHPDDRRVAADALRAHLARHEPFVINTRYVHRDGSVRWFLCRGDAQRDADGRPVRIVGIHTDITAAKKTEAALRAAKESAEAAERSKNEFLAVMSHEIRTPMNGILGFTDLLTGTELDEEQQEYVSTIRSSGDSMMSLLNDILDLSEIEAGGVQLENRPFDLRGFMDELVEAHRAKAEEKQLRVKLEIDPAAPDTVLSDADRLRQVLNNLVNNAIKFTAHGGVDLEVTLAGREGSSASSGLPLWSLEFRISDTGIGIQADRLDRLFKPFSQADSSSTRRYGGTGLGLVLAQRICTLLGGSIRARSEVGKGSVFSFVLALPGEKKEAAPAEPVAADAPPAAEPAAPAGPRLLVAEDNPVNQKLVRAMLRRLGLVADYALNGVETLQMMQKTRYDLILMDVHMPAMDGLMAARRVREEEKMRADGRRAYIIALTADAMPGDREKALESGVDDYLTKPFKQQDLSDAITRARASLGMA